MADVLTVKLGDRGYPIVLGEDVGREVQARIAQLGRAGKRIAVMTDEHVAAKHAGPLKTIFGDAPTWTVAPGEQTKSIAELSRALEFLAGQAFGRSDALFVVGGGVIGDLGGFTAASYLRGIDYYQVPTTLLAMVDSSVGGKTGVNLAAGKNLAGAFYQPRGVFVSTSLLKTLPAREFAAGTAEILKTGLLGDAALFAQLESKPLQPGDSRLPEIIKRCCAIKAGIVEADERELAKEGGRALLNLGHTFGHAIEQATGYAVYLHGEAVAIGLVAAAKLSQELDLISADDAARVAAAVKAHGLPIKLKAKLPLAELMEAAARDKKVRAGQRRFVVLQAVGTAIIRAEIDPARVEAGFRAVGAA